MALQLTKYQDYRDIIRDLSQDMKITYKSLANSSNIHTSYFSRVMGGGADFTGAQLYLIGKDLGLGEWQLDYFLLLGEYSSSANSQHKSFLKEKIKSIQVKQEKVLTEMEDVHEEMSARHVREYYQEAITAYIHILLTVEKYRNSPNLLAGKIGLPEFKIQSELKKLERLGIISLGETIKILKYNVHLDESSEVSPMNHANWRFESINYINRRTPRPSDYHLSAVFSTDEETKIIIKEMFKKFVVQAQKEAAKKRGNEDVFRLCFDLY